MENSFHYIDNQHVLRPYSLLGKNTAFPGARVNDPNNISSFTAVFLTRTAPLPAETRRGSAGQTAARGLSGTLKNSAK